MYAEGDELHYDLTLTTIETTDDDRSVYAEALEAGLAETAQTFVDAAKDVQKSLQPCSALGRNPARILPNHPLLNTISVSESLVLSTGR